MLISMPNPAAAKVDSPRRAESARRAGPSRETIARRAYRIWEEHGRPSGTADQDWRQAETELQAKRWFRFGVREH